jgi:hypothetical protein
MGNACKILVNKPEGRRLGWPRLRKRKIATCILIKWDMRI